MCHSSIFQPLLLSLNQVLEKTKKKIQKFVFARDLKATPLEVDKQRRESIV